jgi:REP element-mobilizing transposase RayT
MNNHFHFLLKETDQPTITKFMHKISTSYAKYFGIKYKQEHSGRVFQGLFKSKYIENQSYLNTLVQYIQNNPVKDGFVDKAEDWIWKGIADNLDEWYGW